MSKSQETNDPRLALFTQLMSSCQPQLLASMFAMVQNMADAEDICQRASLIMWRKFGRFKEGTDFRAWALAICRYEALSFIRKRRGERLFFSEEALAALVDAQDRQNAQVEDQESRWANLNDCINRLPPKQRRIITLYYSESHNIGEVATAIESTEGAVRTALCRARQTLRHCVSIRINQEFAS